MMLKRFPKSMIRLGCLAPFSTFFVFRVRLGAKGPPGTPTLMIFFAKMDPQSSQNGDQDPPADTENTTQANDA